MTDRSVVLSRDHQNRSLAHCLVVISIGARSSGDYTRHDLRRTVATDLQSLDFPISTVAHVLNQSEGGSRVTPIYARHDFSKEKTAALEAWGRHLDALLTGHTSRVVPFAGKRR
jgi:hypothetical protein